MCNENFPRGRDFTRLDGIKNLMEMMKNQNQTGNRMFDVVYGKCSKEVSNDRQVVNLPFTDTLTPTVIPQGEYSDAEFGFKFE